MKDDFREKKREIIKCTELDSKIVDLGWPDHQIDDCIYSLFKYPKGNIES